MTDEERGAMMSRLPLIRSQVIALRNTALHTSEQVPAAEPSLQVGLVLTSNMLSAFAIELALKMFYMALGPEAAHGHALYKLFTQLPPEIQNDVGATYEGNLQSGLTVSVYAFRTAPEMPARPAPLSPLPFSTVEGLLKECSKLFVDARYFPEEVGGEWVMIPHPEAHMRLLIDVLMTWFDEYKKAGGWGPANPQAYPVWPKSS